MFYPTSHPQNLQVDSGVSTGQERVVFKSIKAGNDFPDLTLKVNLR